MNGVVGCGRCYVCRVLIWLGFVAVPLIACGYMGFIEWISGSLRWAIIVSPLALALAVRQWYG